MRYLSLLLALNCLSLPAMAQEEVDRNAQMELMKQNFMLRQGIHPQAKTATDQKTQEKIREQNKEYHNAVLDAVNERKLQLQGTK